MAAHVSTSTKMCMSLQASPLAGLWVLWLLATELQAQDLALIQLPIVLLPSPDGVPAPAPSWIGNETQDCVQWPQPLRHGANVSSTQAPCQSSDRGILQLGCGPLPWWPSTATVHRFNQATSAQPLDR